MAPLICAASNGHVQIVAVLLDAGVDPDWVDEHEGDTALHLAARGGHGRVAQQLIESGATVDAVNAGATALMLAVLGGNVDCVGTLLRLGADPMLKTTLKVRLNEGGLIASQTTRSFSCALELAEVNVQRSELKPAKDDSYYIKGYLYDAPTPPTPVRARTICVLIKNPSLTVAQAEAEVRMAEAAERTHAAAQSLSLHASARGGESALRVSRAARRRGKGRSLHS